MAFLGVSETSSLYRADQTAAKALDVELLLAVAERAEEIERAFNSCHRPTRRPPRAARGSSA
jgi:hypothetical protein